MPTLEPEVGGLDEDGPAERLADACDDGGIERIVDAVAQHERARDGNARIAQHGLAERLVHARRRAEHARADVRQPERLEQALDRAVLAERPVQHGEHDVDLPRPRAVASISAPPPAPGTSEVPPPGRELGRRHASRGGLERGGAVHDLPAAALVDQQRDDVVARRDRAPRSRSARRPARSRARTSGRLRRRRCARDGSRRRVGAVTGWSNCPTVSVTTNGLMFVPSMFWSSTTPSCPASLTGEKIDPVADLHVGQLLGRDVDVLAAHRRHVDGARAVGQVEADSPRPSARASRRRGNCLAT